MGRSQLKYRSTRGRGGDRGGATRTQHDQRRSRGTGKPLGSNAFRFEQRVNEDESEVIGDDPTPSRRQFFADERQYREARESKESYFRTKAMQQWDVEDDEDAVQSIGVLDFAWIADQLKSVPVSLRYQIDPKYCGDTGATNDTAPPSAGEDIDINAATLASTDKALQELLSLSSTSYRGEQRVAPEPSIHPPVTDATVENAEVELEDWLDDVLG